MELNDEIVALRQKVARWKSVAFWLAIALTAIVIFAIYATKGFSKGLEKANSEFQASLKQKMEKAAAEADGQKKAIGTGVRSYGYLEGYKDAQQGRPANQERVAEAERFLKEIDGGKFLPLERTNP